MPDATLTGMTPHRTVNVRWDIAQTVLAEPAHLQRRTSGKDIFPSSSTNIEHLASGVRVLKPENDLRILNESNTANRPYIIRLEDWVFSTLCFESPRHRELTEVLGLSPNADVATEGDWYIGKRVAAGSSWDFPLSPVEAGPLSPALWHYPLDPVAMTPKMGTHSADQAYLVRLILPSALGSNPDVIMAFRFGGEIHAKGYGRFEAVLTGDGRITLYEKRAPAAGGAPVWELVSSWQFTDYKAMAASALTIRIIPHAPKWIEFRVFAGQGVDGRLVNLSDAALEQNLLKAAEHTTLDSHAFETKRPFDVASAGGPNLREITGAGGIMVSTRRDLRLSFQVAKIAYRETGTLIDRPFVIPGGFYSNKVVRLLLRGHQPIGDGTITGSVQGATGAVLATGNESFSVNGGTTALYSGVVPPGGTNAMRVSVTLTNTQTAGSRWRTPSFEGYDIQRHVTQDTFTPGEKTGGDLQNFFVTGPGYHPDHEQCSLLIEDTKNELTSVRTRRTPVLIETTIDAAGVQKAVLFSGVTGRVTGSLKGKHGRVWPREAYHTIRAELMGQWERLANNKFTWQQIDLSDANTHPLGRGGNARQAWKVTDAIWWLLYSCGYSAAELDIFDDPIRFWATKEMVAEGTMVILPGTENIGQLAVHFARYFGNWYLVWDGGAGTTGAGMWRLLRPPTAATPALCSFTLAECPTGKLAHLSASYGTLGGKPIYPILDVDGAEFRSYTQYPEANIVTVLGLVQVLPTGGRNFFWQQAINFTSWECPGRESLADPSSPDWLGDCRPIEIPDSTLPNQASVNFVCRRVFEAACRGRRRHSFAAELVLVNVSASETFHTARTHRPLRAGDVVNLIDMDGVVTKCVVHSANFSVERSHAMLMYLEIEEFREQVTLGGWRTR